MPNPLPEQLQIEVVNGPLSGTVTIPGSKSITNRALILAAMADGNSRLTGALMSDDTHYMSHALNMIGISVASNEHDCTFDIVGAGGKIPATVGVLFVGNAGTAARFLTGLLAMGHGKYRIDGVERMRQRPIADMLPPLRAMGCNIESEFGTGCPPLVIQSSGLSGGEVTVKGNISSQYLSALLMIAPYAQTDVIIHIDGELVSRPYVEITTNMMKHWGVQVQANSPNEFLIQVGQKYKAQTYVIEPDASGASYFFAAAALTGGTITIPNLSKSALQGDVGFLEVLELMGCTITYGEGVTTVTGPSKLNGVDVDMNGISDTVMTLAAIAPFASSPTSIRNVGNIRYKETDRLAALAIELTKMGVTTEEKEDAITIFPQETIAPTLVHTYDDHRMAMSFAITGLRAKGITIDNPACVAKTFPDFFERLNSLRN